MGIINAIGNTVAENHISLKKEKTGITTETKLFSSRYAGMLPFGAVPIDTAELQRKLKATKKGLTRTILLALHAFEEAIEDAQLSTSILSSPDTALIGAGTVGGMCLTDELYADAHAKEKGSEFVTTYDSASVNIYLQQQYQIAGVINTINTACSSSANAIMYGARLIKNGLAKRAIVGGVDSLAKFTVNGFNALHILSPETCKPFDANRKGLNLGEGAAFLVLEKEEDVSGKRVYAALSGYSNTNDAYHPSSLSEQGNGPFLAMQQALQSAGLSPQEIDFINAHGTGTENNDEVESKAMMRLFNTVPAFGSSKSYIGHTLGAAGVIEAIHSILNIIHQELYPNLHFQEPISSTGLYPVQSYKKAKLNHVMSNSFGFGGNCSSLIFSKT